MCYSESVKRRTCIDFLKKDIITVDVRMEEMGRRLVKSATDRIKCPTVDLPVITIATYPKL